jgi:hypothetical protein
LILACAVLLLQVAPAIQAVPKAAVAAAAAGKNASTLPAAPAPNKVGKDADANSAAAPGTLLAESNASAGQDSRALETVHVTQFPPTKAGKVVGVENLPSRRAWILLSIADHSAAAFDAYSTRAAVSRGAVEADPLVRPFAGSDGLYAAIQVAPVALDYVARRMQRSQNSVLRRIWWLPQTASTGLYLFAGSHNLTVAGR